VAAELGTNCNLGKTMASVCPAWRCPHQVKEKKMSKELMRSYSTISIGDEAQRRI